MNQRVKSMTPSAIRSRERRFNAWLKREENKFNAEIRRHMDSGLSFDDAWVTAGGTIIPTQTQSNGAKE